MSLRCWVCVVVAMILVGCGGCQDPTSPTKKLHADNPRKIDEPLGAQAALEHVVECSGTSGTLDEVQWFVADELVDTSREQKLLGAWVRPNSIYLLKTTREEPRVLRHEILHHILQDHTHPEPPFGVCDQ